MEAETVDRGHRCSLCVEFSVDLREEKESVAVVSVHVIEDALGGVGEGIGLGSGVLRCGYPTHDAEASNVVNVDGFEAEEGEVGEVDPVLAVGMGLEVELASFGLLYVWELQDVAHEGDACGSKDVAVRGGLGYEKTGARVGLEVLGMHRHRADEEERSARGIQSVGH
jgi:hypothetical protein